MRTEKISELPAKIDLELLTRELEKLDANIRVQRVITSDDVSLIIDMPGEISLLDIKQKIAEHRPESSDFERVSAVVDTNMDWVEWRASIERRLEALENKK